MICTPRSLRKRAASSSAAIPVARLVVRPAAMPAARPVMMSAGIRSARAHAIDKHAAAADARRAPARDQPKATYDMDPAAFKPKPSTLYAVATPIGNLRD